MEAVIRSACPMMSMISFTNFGVSHVALAWAQTTLFVSPTDSRLLSPELQIHCYLHLKFGVSANFLVYGSRMQGDGRRDRSAQTNATEVYCPCLRHQPG